MGTTTLKTAEEKPIVVENPAEIMAAAGRACKAVAPCWPLKDFVAVNPFLGLSAASFPEVADRMAAVAGARLFMPRAFYADALATGRITEEDLKAALEAEPAAARNVGGLHPLKAAMRREPHADKTPVLPTVADEARNATGTDWPAFVCDRLSRWAAAYFDQGQASWSSPWRHMRPYAAWRAEALVDRTPAVMGLEGFRAVIALLPESPEELIEHAVHHLGIPEPGLEYYFHRLLMTQGGWAAHLRYQDWQQELAGEESSLLLELLAIRLAWEVALLQCLAHTRLPRAWRKERDRLAISPAPREVMARYAVEILLQHAYEHAWQKQLLDGFKGVPTMHAAARPTVQAAFCIDVRSEVYRRALEACSDDIETLGFAGFFGVPMAYAPFASAHARPQCPALIAPQFVIQERLAGASVDEEQELVRRRKAWSHASRAWQSFKQGAVASFGFVETLGITYLFKLWTDAFGLTRPVVEPKHAGLPNSVSARLKPHVDRAHWNNASAGLEKEAQVEIAASALRGMSCTERFARMVLLAGHGATSTNNPHAAGLDCGACGGHSGESNARVMAAILNDAHIRTALADQGIVLPVDTVFVAGNHDTTSDTLTLFDTELVPESHQDDLKSLRARLEEATRRARRERAGRLHLDQETALDKAFRARGRDWSQVRPEWGLAGCAAFIAAPRHRTRRLSLGGRAFLHDYDWSQDETFGVLESVMTAPLVVATWIGMQYYASTVDSAVFGSGDKTLHNVVGTLGVLEGNGGDLRVGLPWQSVHDGERLVHEPLRLTALIEAPVQAINAVIEKHESLRALLDNGWVHLFALDASGEVSCRYTGGGAWAETETGEPVRVVAA